MSKKTKKDTGPGAIARLRNYLLTGFIVAAPIAATLYVIWLVVTLTDEWFKPWIPDIYNPDNYLPVSIPGIGLAFVIVVLVLLGFITVNFFGRRLINIGERLVNRMPLVRTVYNTFKQIIETVLAERSNSFQNAALLEYPRKGIWAIVFVATDTKGEVRDKLQTKERHVSVFLPTTPNPTSGFLLFVPESDLKYLDMSVEDAAKLVISAGLVTPETVADQLKKAKDPKSPKSRRSDQAK